jgi:putative MATE family efflux protein
MDERHLHAERSPGGAAGARRRPLAPDSEVGAESALLDAPAPAPAARPGAGVLRLAWPAIAANVLHAAVGLIDIKIVAALGPRAVAAVTTGNRIFFVLQALLMALTAGTTALVARAWGAGNRREAERVTRASTISCAFVAALLGGLGLAFAEPLAGLFRLDAETRALAATFIRWTSLFNASFAVFFALGTALRAAGDTRTPLWLGAFANAVNVILVYGLVYGRLGLPALGVAGAAIASGVAFTASAALTLALWLGGRFVLGVGPPGALSVRRLRALLRIGWPAALEQGAWQGGFILFLWIVSLYGTAPYAAYGIGVSILAVSFVVGFGFQIAAATLVGQRLGAGDGAGARASGWRAMRLSVAAMAALGGAIVLAAGPIARLMIDDPEVVRLTVVFIYLLGAAQPLMAIEFALGGALRGAGDTRSPFFAVLAGLLGVRCALAALFAWLGLPVEWIFAALLGDYTVKASFLVARFRSGRWLEVEVGARGR